MKIALVIRLFSPEIGGVESVARQLAGGLAASGHDVHVFTSEKGECTLPGVTVHKVRGWQFSSIAKTLSFPYFAKKALEQDDFDIVHAFSRMSGVSLYRLADPPQHAHIFRGYHGFRRSLNYLNPRNRALLWLEDSIYKDPEIALVTNSHRTKKDLVRFCGVDHGRVGVIRNGVDTERFHPGLRERFRSDLLEAQGIPGGARILLFIGNDFRRKGLSETFSVLERLMQPDQQASPVHLLVVGLERCPAFREEAKTRGIEKQVHFFGRCKNPERYYGAADLFILPTREDPFANTVLESLACGIPVVTTRTNGAAEILSPGEDGAVVPAADSIEEMVTAARALLNHPRIEQVRQAARAKALGFSWNETVGNFVRLYQKIIERPPVPGPNGAQGIRYLDPGVRESFKGSPDGFSAIMDKGGESRRHVARRQTLRIEIDGESYFLKKHRGIGWREIFKNLLSLKRPILSAKTEWKGICELESLGIATLTPAGFGERGWNPAKKQSFLMTRELQGMVKLSRIRDRLALVSPEQSARVRRALILAVAALAKKFHKAGCAHFDFYLCHFLVVDRDWAAFREGDRLELHLIDLHRMYRYHRLPLRKRVNDLSALYFSARDLNLSKEERILFIRTYGSPETNGGFWERVERRAEALHTKGASRNNRRAVNQCVLPRSQTRDHQGQGNGSR